MSYAWPGMIKLNRLQALRLWWYEAKTCIYKLYDDDTESLCETEDDIWNHNGDFGMELSDESSLYPIIATWLVKYGTENTSSGSCIIFWNEVAEKFGVEEKWVQDNARDIADYLDQNFEEILSETWLDDGGFDMNFGLAYCPNVEEDGI